MKKEAIGAAIRAARTEGLGQTRKAFGKVIGVTDQTVYYWEIGKRSPRGEAFVRLLAEVPPHFALRLLNAAGMRNTEAWAFRVNDEIGSRPASPAEVVDDGT